MLLGRLGNIKSIAVLKSPVHLIEGFGPFLPVLAGHSILEVRGRAIGVDVRFETFESTVGSPCEVLLMFPCSYCQKLQQICILLLLCYSDEGVLASVDLQDHHVAHHVVVDLLVVADMQLVVKFQLAL